MLQDAIGVTKALCERFGTENLEGLYSTVEAIYQAGKYTCLKGPKPYCRSAIDQFTLAGKWGADGLSAKRAGCAKARKQSGAVLDQNKWRSSVSLNVMKLAIYARAASDEKYALNLTKAVKEKFVWLHLEPRSGKGAYWGGSFRKGGSEWQGKNMLGQLMLEVGQLLIADSADAADNVASH